MYPSHYNLFHNLCMKTPVACDSCDRISPRAPCAGAHDVNKTWMRRLQAADRSAARVVPRVLLDGWAGKDYEHVLASKQGRMALVATLAGLLDAHGLDGVEAAVCVLVHCAYLLDVLAPLADAKKK